MALPVSFSEEELAEVELVVLPLLAVDELELVLVLVN
jgi:hypothetical protein